VYRPEEETVPAEADQVTAWLAPPFTVTVAVNCWLPPTCREAVKGAIDTDTTPGAVVVTVTVAEALLLESATEVAVTV